MASRKKGPETISLKKSRERGIEKKGRGVGLAKKEGQDTLRLDLLLPFRKKTFNCNQGRKGPKALRKKYGHFIPEKKRGKEK